MERVIPHAKVKDRIAALAVGLFTDCDRPERDVEKIMRAHLPNASTLPFAGFVTHKGEWVGGFSGFKDTRAFLAVLEAAEKTPYLQASKAVQKKLAALVAKAEKATDKGDWKPVMQAARAGAKTTGRCPERQALAGLVKKARAWAAGEFDAAVRFARPGGDLMKARQTLSAVRKQFAGEPEGADASKGLKAVQALSRIVDAESGDSPPPAGIREKAARPYRDTRWASIFEKAPAEGE